MLGKEASRRKKLENGYRLLGKKNEQKELEKTGCREDMAPSLVLESGERGEGPAQGRGSRIQVSGREKAADFDGSPCAQGWAKGKEIK